MGEEQQQLFIVLHFLQPMGAIRQGLAADLYDRKIWPIVIVIGKV